ncbi:hypothetical protein [Candidatus Methanosphaera massiliense]|uniref:hypothetical protein n=1 Tax=Candidatus Methanosphaera massiliense TaxID=3017187 RepID=UPI00237FF9A9|nr:hypothetical protein [Candidatus Methanosphaera massiliense]MDD6286460.1 hypothetical protein [Methanobacteriaceae archaeon]MDE4078901.1 hypothetical protein [Candidatus Methanosphaera massiliense]
MFESIRKNKIKTLEPKRDLINNDIDITEYDMRSVFTLIAITTLFLVSMKLVLIAGHI